MIKLTLGHERALATSSGRYLERSTSMDKLILDLEHEKDVLRKDLDRMGTSKERETREALGRGDRERNSDCQ